MGVECGMSVRIYWLWPSTSYCLVIQNLMTDDPSVHTKSAQRVLPDPCVRLQVAKPLKSHIKVDCSCTHTNVNITMKSDFQYRFHLHNILLLFLVQSENTIRIITELILKNSISVSQAEQSEGPASVMWSFKRARSDVNRPIFRLDSNSCWKIYKLTAATFKMPLFFSLFSIKSLFSSLNPALC